MGKKGERMMEISSWPETPRCEFLCTMFHLEALRQLLR
jgi:hypothetical protein